MPFDKMIDDLTDCIIKDSQMENSCYGTDDFFSLDGTNQMSVTDLDPKSIPRSN